jgi:hypothetical protein
MSVKMTDIVVEFSLSIFLASRLTQSAFALISLSLSLSLSLFLSFLFFFFSLSLYLSLPLCLTFQTNAVGAVFIGEEGRINI